MHEARSIGIYAALADVVCRSQEFLVLFTGLDNAWARLRGLRKAFSENPASPIRPHAWPAYVALAEPRAARLRRFLAA
jgi:hypothetical protein